MKVRRHIKGVLGNALMHLISRYSDYDGYWLIGLLITEGDDLRFPIFPNLGAGGTTLERFTGDMARATFEQQLEKAHVPLQCITSACFLVQNTGRRLTGLVNHQPAQGFEVSVKLIAVSDIGKEYSAGRLIFVSPHNPAVEHRSIRRL
jgi:hypothetical protein